MGPAGKPGVIPERCVTLGSRPPSLIFRLLGNRLGRGRVAISERCCPRPEMYKSYGWFPLVIPRFSSVLTLKRLLYFGNSCSGKIWLCSLTADVTAQQGRCVPLSRSSGHNGSSQNRKTGRGAVCKQWPTIPLLPPPKGSLEPRGVL